MWKGWDAWMLSCFVEDRYLRYYVFYNLRRVDAASFRTVSYRYEERIGHVLDTHVGPLTYLQY